MRNQPLVAFCAAMIVAGSVIANSTKPPAPTPPINSGQPEGRPSGERDRTSSTDERGSKDITLSEKTTPSPKAKAEAETKAKEHDEKALYDFLTGWGTAATAAFTLLLVVIAAMQVGFFYVQLRFMRKGLDDAKTSVDLAREEFLATHRPRIRVRTIVLQYPIQENIRIIIAIANVGETQATLCSVMCDVYRRPKGEPDYFRSEDFSTEHLLTKVQLKSGQAWLLLIDTDKQPNIADTLGETELCAAGVLRYDDLRGVSRQTGFFRVANEANRFVKGDDGGFGYEYED